MTPMARPTSSGGLVPLPSTNAGYPTSASPSPADSMKMSCLKTSPKSYHAEEPLDHAVDERLQADARRPVHGSVEEIIIEAGLPVDAVADLELEQVVVPPVERDLDEVVQEQ